MDRTFTGNNVPLVIHPLNKIELKLMLYSKRDFYTCTNWDILPVFVSTVAVKSLTSTPWIPCNVFLASSTATWGSSFLAFIWTADNFYYFCDTCVIYYLVIKWTNLYNNCMNSATSIFYNQLEFVVGSRKFRIFMYVDTQKEIFRYDNKSCWTIIDGKNIGMV